MATQGPKAKARVIVPMSGTIRVGCHLVSKDTKTLGVSGSGVLRFKLIPYIFEVGTCLRLFFWFFLYFRMRTATIFCENTFLCEYFVTLITTFKMPKKEPSRPNG